MPKLKTHRGTAKRIRITSTKKMLRQGAGDKHFNEKKSESTKRATAVGSTIVGKLKKNLRRALGV